MYIQLNDINTKLYVFIKALLLLYKLGLKKAIRYL